MYNLKNNKGRYTTRKHYPLVILHAALIAWYRRIGITKTLATIALILILYPMLSDIYGTKVIVNKAEAK